MEVIKSYIRAKLFRLLSAVIPELNFLKHYCAILKGEISDSVLEEPVKLYSPYRIIESKIGKYTYISERSIISKTEIGRFCSIGPGVICGWGIHPTDGISTSPMFYSTKKQNGFSFARIDKTEERKPIVIGNDVLIGMNVMVLDGITIGDGAIIGAGCVVSKNVPPYAIVAGNPFRILRYRFSDEIIHKMLVIQWWNFEFQKLQSIADDLFDIEKFVAANYKEPVE